MRTLLTITAVLESATGVSLLVFPSLVAKILLGSPLDSPATVAVARITGVALVVIGVHCWMARSDAASPAARGVIAGVVLYNVGVVAVLVLAATGGGQRLVGVGLWPAAALHAVFAAWCIACLARRWRDTLGSSPANPP